MDLSRLRLKTLANWIRDDLDPMVAQNGPQVLSADTVLILHEVFQALATASTISVLDLRATGIHRAVMEVSGIATRWPGRLADDCDRIILAWTSKFGRLEELHPFMHGRGGRLEGIASANEISGAALLKRWQATCPERLAPKRSHRHGSLGFKPGAWWMNTLFAHHSGIIDLQSTEGGICFDQHGAYAVVLLDTEDIDPGPDSDFTFRCKPGEKGKYLLTAANHRSRSPVRVLRAHSLNSILGPKAGIRYDGLHRVVGWTVRTAKLADTLVRSCTAGDILYDVKFERVDSVPLDEVMKHPTASELDDYAEYKRLRRLQREERRKGTGALADKIDVQMPAKDAPPIAPVSTIYSKLRAHSPSRSAASKDIGAAIPDPTHLQQTTPPRMSFAASRTSALSSTVGVETSALDLQKSTLGIPLPGSRGPSIARIATESLKLETEVSLRSPNTAENSIRSGRSGHSDIREIAPWIDEELELSAAAPSSMARPNRQQQAPTPVRTPTTRSITARSTGSVRSAGLRSPSQAEDEQGTSSGGVVRNIVKNVLPRNRNPSAKLFDGNDSVKYQGSDEFSLRASHASSSYEPSSPMSDQNKRPSSACTSRSLGSVHVRPSSPLITDRRNAASFPSASSPVLEHFTPAGLSAHECTSADDPFVEPCKQSKALSFPTLSLQRFISSPKTVTSINESPGTSKRTPDYPSSTAPAECKASFTGTSLKDGLREIAGKSINGSGGGRTVFKDAFEKIGR